ncbi:hypothetical protein QO004_005140 [Rhizobium mesoamericanum]|uniref:hypothetical protein n=1 Tax=Rhizobium mesoamericanum TaxID=1079800 RepID=UPI00277ED567|nr:hypothetical protein [Rhizobium mesoamericanum]MDQ0563331.1 hypothetical protein [Rhizobium mesoamericanum]
MLKRNFLVAAALVASLVHTEAVSAQTLSYADAVTKLADDCGADIQTLCKGLNLGGGRIADCLQQNAAKVSPTCKSSLSTVFQSIGQREHAQASYEQVCQRDMSKSCSGIKGDGYVLACLVKKEKRVSKECNQVITDAGWR